MELLARGVPHELREHPRLAHKATGHARRTPWPQAVNEEAVDLEGERRPVEAQLLLLVEPKRLLDAGGDGHRRGGTRSHERFRTQTRSSHGSRLDAVGCRNDARSQTWHVTPPLRSSVLACCDTADLGTTTPNCSHGTSSCANLKPYKSDRTLAKLRSRRPARRGASCLPVHTNLTLSGLRCAPERLNIEVHMVSVTGTSHRRHFALRTSKPTCHDGTENYEQHTETQKDVKEVRSKK